MSDETTPKLRLRPKLAGGQPAVTPDPASQSEEPGPNSVSTPAPIAAVPAVRSAALRPKLSLRAEEPEKVVEPPPIIPTREVEMADVEPEDPRAFPPPPPKPVLAAISPRLKPALSPTDRQNSGENTGAVPPFPVGASKDRLPGVLNAPPPPRLVPLPKTEETWPAVLDAPPPPGLAPTIAPLKPEEEPAEITAIRKASTFPFPSPTAKFPPLPGLGSSSDSIPPEKFEQEGFLKKLLLIGVLAIVLLAAAVFGYFKFFAKSSVKPVPSPAADASKPTVSSSETKDQMPSGQPVAPQAAVAVPSESTPPVAATETPLANSVPVPAPDVATVPTEKTATQESPSIAESSPVSVKAPPPQPSLAFKAWVINLRIRGVRGGDAQRVFIDKTSYVPGDVVNQQLGIVFVGYDESRRMLTFQDKSGATFERRH